MDSQSNAIEQRADGASLNAPPHVRRACALVLLVVLLERLSFYGLSSNLVLELNSAPLDWDAVAAAQAQLALSGAAYATAPLAGWLADAALGRYNTVALGLLVYTLGVLIFPGLATPDTLYLWCGLRDFLPVHSVTTATTTATTATTTINTTTTTAAAVTANWTDALSRGLAAGAPSQAGFSPAYCRTPIYVGLIVMAVGIGAVKANITAFGADQVRSVGGDSLRRFFSLFYWSVNGGAVLALGVVTFVQENCGFAIGNSVAAAALLLALAAFLAARGAFLHRGAAGSPIVHIAAAACHRCCGGGRMVACCGANDDDDGDDADDAEALVRPDSGPDSGWRSDGDSAPSDPGFGRAVRGARRRQRRGGGATVRSLRRVVPVFVALVPYWMVYFQMQSTYLLQSLHLRVPTFSSGNITGHKHTVVFPAAWLTMLDVLLLLVMLPVAERWAFPLLRAARRLPSTLRRIALGMACSLLSVSAAGVLELCRLRVFVAEGRVVEQQVGGTLYDAADLSVFAQTPQFILIALAELLASVAGLEFAYSESPPSLRAAVMGLFFLSAGVGSLLGSGLLQAATAAHWLSPFDSGNINHSRLDLYFFTLAGIQAGTLIGFVLLTVTYEARRKRWTALRGTADPAINHTG